MVIYARTAVAIPGKIFEAVAWAKEVQAVVNSIWSSGLMVSLRVGGNPNEICWSGRFGTLADMEQAMVKLNAAPDYVALIKKAEHLLCPGMTKEQIWREV